jgi:outer membrane protein assembly factor BamB
MLRPRQRCCIYLYAACLYVGVTATSPLSVAQPPLDDRPPQKTGFMPAIELKELPHTAWQFTSERGQRRRGVGLSDPATWGGMLFFGDDLGVVRAVTARRGVPIWTHEHGERVYFPPTCDGQRLFFTTRKGIAALQCTSGIFLWHRSVSHSVGRCVAWKPADAVYFSDSDGWMYAVDAESGDLKWQTAFVADAPDDPPGFDGERARFDGTKARPTGIATDGSRVYQSVFDQCRVVSFDAKTGTRRSSFQTKGWIFADPAVDDQRLYVGSQDKHLYCFDKQSGNMLWKFATGSRIESGPGVTKDRVVVGSCDGSVYCCDKRTGALLWKMQTDNPGAIYSAAIVTEDTAYLASGEGTVYALSLDTGTPRWKYRPLPTSDLYSSMATDGTHLFVKSRPQDEKQGVNAIVALGPPTPEDPRQ